MVSHCCVAARALYRESPVLKETKGVMLITAFLGVEYKQDVCVYVCV